MNFIEKISLLDGTINHFVPRMLKNHINNGENDIEPIPEDELYHVTIFNNLIVTGHSYYYKLQDNIQVWLVSDFDEELYRNTIYDYLESNKTEHGKLVFDAFLKNKERYYEYFSEESNIILNKSGIIFVLVEKNEKNEIIKSCYFKEFDLD